MSRDRFLGLVNKCIGAQKIVVTVEGHVFRGTYTLRRDEYDGIKVGTVRGLQEAEYVATRAQVQLAWLCPVPSPMPEHRVLWMRHEGTIEDGRTRAQQRKAERKAERKAIGDAARAKGENRELRAIGSLSLGEIPAWLLSVRRATQPEDFRGIDLVGESDVGTLLVQVKGCAAAARSFKADPRSRYIEVVIVDERTDDATIRIRVLEAFGRARDATRERETKRSER